jgi:hypothetical protein
MKFKVVIECCGPNNYPFPDSDNRPCSAGAAFESAVEITVTMEPNSVGFYPRLNFSTPKLPAAWEESGLDNAYCCPICREILMDEAIADEKKYKAKNERKNKKHVPKVL